jgi:hypothetical protein
MLRIVKLVDSNLGFLVVLVVHETKALALAIFVDLDKGGSDAAELSEELLKLIL